MSERDNPTSAEQVADLDRLIDEVRLVNHRLVQVAERIHVAAPVTVAERALLEYLFRNGAETVPAIARDRGVTRQHVQVGVNALLEEGLVEQVPNPAHARSHLIDLTEGGAGAIESMKEVEAALLASLDLPVPAFAIQEAANVLESLRAALAELD